MFPTAFTSVDTTMCPIQVPSGSKKVRCKFYSYKRLYTVKYEIAVSNVTGEIVWAMGAYPGSFNDIKIVKRSGFLSLRLYGEVTYGDKEYNTKELRIMTPLKINQFRWIPKPYRDSYNLCIRHHRVRVEQTLAKVKSFRVTSSKWRHDLSLHSKAFCCVCKIVNCMIKQKCYHYW